MGSVWVAVLLGAGTGRRPVVDGRRDPRHRQRIPAGRRPARARLAAAVRSPGLSGRILGGVVVAALTLTLTRWPVAAVGLGALVVWWPALFGGTHAEQRQIAVAGGAGHLDRDAAGHHRRARQPGTGHPGVGGERADVDPTGTGRAGRPAAGESADGPGVVGIRGRPG